MSASPIQAAVKALPFTRTAHGITAAVNPAATSLCLLATDLIAIVIATLAGVEIWSLVNPSITLSNYFHLGTSLTLFFAVFLGLGLYQPAGLGPTEELRRIVLGTVLVSLVLTAAVFMTKVAGVYSRGAFLTSGALVCLLVPVSRGGLRALCARQAWWGVPVLILGAGKTARLLIEKLRGEPALGLKPVACLDDDPAKHGECLGVAVPGPLAWAPRIAAGLGVEHLLVAMPGVEREKLLAIVERYGASFARIIVVPDLFGIASLWVTPHDMGGVLGLEVRQNLLVPVNRLIKRAMDLALAGALGLLSLPVIALAAVWIKAVSPGSAFYIQRREGEHGRTISVPKLRTMYPGADDLLAEHLLSSPAARAEWETHCKLRDDPRILPGIGRLLRRTSLDELPQLFSVLKGEMSLVGPRPFPAYHLDRFDARFRAFRARVKPGLSGLWQVTARSEGDLRVQQELDTYYIRNWSLWLELVILARTVSAVLRGRGAY